MNERGCGVQDDKAEAEHNFINLKAGSFVAIHLKKGSLLLSKLPSSIVSSLMKKASWI